METLDLNSPNSNSPNKRQKSETLTLDSPILPSIDKGKAPIIVDNDDESENGCESPANSTPDNCGICLTEEGKTVRGLIDSCDHYFCFLCIIEWSKIESRCPLCRGRFSTIRRVRKDGSFIGEGSVRVPVRDQIYDPFGEPVDPYGQAKCSVCNGATDECLLLLCDLCDSASHTYCVGLGATVPEGDWYCRDCALLRAEQLESEIGDNVNTSIVSPHFDESSTSASVSIFDIVRDPINSKKPDSGTDRLRKLVSRQPTKFSSSAIASDQPIVSSARTGARGNLHSSVDSPESSARTLQNCRNVHRHINVLRENWGAFRTGSLSFSLTFSDSFGKASQKKNAVGTQAERSSKSQFRSSLQSKAGDSLHDATREKESYNVDRAWKLMTKAKTVHQTAESKKNFQNKAHSSQINKFVPKCVVSGRKDLISPRIMKLKPTDKMSGRPAESSVDHQFTSFTSLTATACGSKHQKFCVPNLSVPREMELASKYSMYHNRTCFAPSKKLKRRETMIFDGSGWSESSCGPIAGTPDVSCARLQKKESLACPAKQAGPLDICSLSKRELQTSVIADICRDKTGLLSYANLGRRCISDEQNGFPCSTSSHEPIVGGSDASHVRLEGRKIPACQGEVRAKITSKGSKYDETKGEIQSLVKLNLKLLCKDKRLGMLVKSLRLYVVLLLGLRSYLLYTPSLSSLSSLSTNKRKQEKAMCIGRIGEILKVKVVEDVELVRCFYFVATLYSQMDRRLSFWFPRVFVLNVFVNEICCCLYARRLK